MHWSEVFTLYFYVVFAEYNCQNMPRLLKSSCGAPNSDTVPCFRTMTKSESITVLIWWAIEIIVRPFSFSRRSPMANLSVCSSNPAVGSVIYSACHGTQATMVSNLIPKSDVLQHRYHRWIIDSWCYSQGKVVTDWTGNKQWILRN